MNAREFRVLIRPADTRKRMRNVSVTAADAEDALRRVRVLYPNAAVLRARLGGGAS